MKSKTCLIFDLDGTIIFENAPLNPKLEAMLTSLARKGHELVFATARSLRGVRVILPDELLQCRLILCNGAFAWYSHRVIYADPIEKEVVVAMSTLLDHENICYVIECGNAYYHPSGQHTFFDVLHNEAQAEKLPSLGAALQKPVYKISILEPGWSKDEAHILKRLQQDTSSVMLVRHADGGCDLINRKTSKWNCFTNILDVSGFSRLMCFGNDDNDVEMFEHIHDSVLVGNHRVLSRKATHIINETDPQDIEDQLLTILQEVRL